ncbi:SubName: Full=Uncharacterized protein {ECO:0000313/EMBL:CCA67034.1} [Serendipita indica DSM 11827]|nr:SubName: Full=Uncharacterized protein {ECO:0000313/EMBL:CCA67034.1} [Serendipita indica DSM 11827]
MSDQRSYCIHCRRQFDSVGQLNTHFSNAHKESLHCEQCGLWFRYATNLTQHLASPVHNERNLPCPHCSEVFKTTSGVAHHLEYKCLRKVTEAVIKWDTDHQITDRVYTNRIREVSEDGTDYDDDILFSHHTTAMQQILDVLATEETWNATVDAYVCPWRLASVNSPSFRI